MTIASSLRFLYILGGSGLLYGVRASVRASASKSYCQRALDPATQLRAKNSAIQAHQGAYWRTPYKSWTLESTLSF